MHAFFRAISCVLLHVFLHACNFACNFLKEYVGSTVRPRLVNRSGSKIYRTNRNRTKRGFLPNISAQIKLKNRTKNQNRTKQDSY